MYGVECMEVHVWWLEAKGMMTVLDIPYAADDGLEEGWWGSNSVSERLCTVCFLTAETSSVSDLYDLLSSCYKILYLAWNT